MFENTDYQPDYLDGIGEVGRITLTPLQKKFLKKHPYYKKHLRALMKISPAGLRYGLQTLPRIKLSNFPLQGLEEPAPPGISNAVLLAVRNERSADPITRTGTIIEQKTGFPVVIKAIQAGPGRPLKTIVTPLPLTSPLDVDHYEKDTDTATIFPVFKRERVSNPASYREMSANPALYFPNGLSGLSDPYVSESGLEGYGDAELSGLFDVLKSAFTSTKKFITHPIQTIKTSIANRRLKKAIRGVSEPGKLTPDVQTLGGKKVGKTSLAQLTNLIGTVLTGRQQEAAQNAVESGDTDTAMRLLAAAQGQQPPETTGAGYAGGGALPGWVLPAGIGVAALLFMKGTKYAPGGGRRRRK